MWAVGPGASILVKHRFEGGRCWGKAQPAPQLVPSLKHPSTPLQYNTKGRVKCIAPATPYPYDIMSLASVELKACGTWVRHVRVAQAWAEPKTGQWCGAAGAKAASVLQKRRRFWRSSMQIL